MRVIRGPEHAPLRPLTGRRVAVVGFGNQGRAHALCLRDSGVEVVVGNRPDSPGWGRALECGFDPLPVATAVQGAGLVILALPDHVQPEVFARSIAPHAPGGAIVGFLHGFTIRYGLIRPSRELGVVLVAPKGPGETLRRLFCEGRGLPCLFAVHQDSPAGDAEAVGLAWAAAIGAARSAILFTTFSDETETDLFGEQAVLCGGLSALVRAAFEALVEAGYPPELAYLETCHEVKQVADLIYRHGLAGSCRSISATAEFGAYRAGERLIDGGCRERLRELLEEIRDGTFAAALRGDHERGFPWFSAQRSRALDHPMERAGDTVRSYMPGLAADPSGDAPPRPRARGACGA
jgi:ketol-acid reductoisomerase